MADTIAYDRSDDHQCTIEVIGARGWEGVSIHHIATTLRSFISFDSTE